MTVKRVTRAGTSTGKSKAKTTAKPQPLYPDYTAVLCDFIVQQGYPPPKREHRFHRVRKWRVDMAYPDHKIILEVEGQVFRNGRHNRGIGFTNDCTKYNEATLLGWRVFRIPSQWITDGTAHLLVLRILETCGVQKRAECA